MTTAKANRRRISAALPAAREPRKRFAKRRLEDATVQELQLELLRRTQHDAFDGEKIVTSLLNHRDLWRSVVFMPLLVFGRGDNLPVLGFITLRDMSENYWNADTLYILTDNVTKARRVEKVARTEAWAGEVSIFHDSREVSQALGAYEREAIVRLVGLNLTARYARTSLSRQAASTTKK